MVERTSYSEGTPSWVDLSTSDPAAAQAFYGGLFGWEFEARPTDQGGEYLMATMGGKSAAGMMQQSPGQAEMGLPSLWNTYITVDDIAASIAKVEAAGGTVMMPSMQVMEAGHMAVIGDPTGAVICMWQPIQHIGCEVVNEPGALIWNEMSNTDVASAKQFYEAVFGMGSVDQDMGAPDPYTVFTVDEEMVAGAMVPPMEGIPNHWAVYFAVDDADASAAKAADLGGTVFAPVMEIPTVGRIAGISDPTGAMFFLMQPAEEDLAA